MKGFKKALSIMLSVSMLSGLCVMTPITAHADGGETPQYETYAQDTVQGSAILHCFDWSYNNIRANLPQIAAAGYTAIQTSPVQQPKDYSADWTDGSAQWWKLYQPLGLTIADGGTWLGTKAELTQLCTEAENYNIKIIVDIVANHLANDGTRSGSFYRLSPDVESDMKDIQYYHNEDTYTNDTNRYNITHYHLGQPDLNTANSYVQTKVLNLLKDCVDCGVDGFRFDAAKHIEVPEDGGGVGSQFWPTVINGIKNYAETKNTTLYIYGEILGNSTSDGSGTNISYYTNYMDVTDNYAGDRALAYANDQNAGGLAIGSYTKVSNDPTKNVIWAESHDTYMGSSGTGGISNTSGIDDTVIKRTWAIVGARAGSTALYFARPNAVMGEASSDTAWKDTEVAEVNKFKTHFNGTVEYLGYDQANKVTYVERGSNGVVISKLDGAGSVDLKVAHMAEGTYTDAITGNAFSVESVNVETQNGTITETHIIGDVGDTGVAVVYDKNVQAYDYEETGTVEQYITNNVLYFIPSEWWKQHNARFAMYLFDAYGNERWVNMQDVGDGHYAGIVPAGYWTSVIFCRMNPATTENNWNNEVRWNQTNNLYPQNHDDNNCFAIVQDNWHPGESGTWSNYTKYYTVTWNNYDNSTLETDSSVPFGTIPSYDGAAPEKTRNAQYSYTFTGWSPAISVVTGDVTYTAQFTQTTNHYTVTFKNDDGTVLQSGLVEYGDTPAYTGTTPTKEADAQYTYTYNNWDSPITTVTDNVVYTATYTPTIRKYTITFKDEDGTELQSSEFEYGQMPTCTTPTKAGDAQYTYSFAVWTPAVATVTGEATYTATYSTETNKYTITWVDGNGETLKTEEVAYGETPAYTGTTPTKTATDQYSYSFNNTWTPEISSVTGAVTYTAQFDQTERTYTVTWKDGDTVLETDADVSYGTPSSYDSAAPTKEEYEFVGWLNGDVEYVPGTAVTGNITLVANWKMPIEVTFGETRFTANEQEHTVDITVKYNGIDLTENTDYTVTGTRSATAAGRYTVKVEGIGNYTGAAETEWTITSQLTVTVSHPGLTTPSYDTYTYGAKATINAPAGDETTKFAYWKNGDTIVSYSAKYSFIVTKDMNLTAEYVDKDTVVTPEPILIVSSYKDSVNNQNAVRINFDRSVPYDGFNVVEAGVIYTTNKLWGNDNAAEALDLSKDDLIAAGNASKIRKRSVETNMCNGTIDVIIPVGAKTDARIYAVGYVKDSEGNFYYSDLISTTYNTASAASTVS